MKACNPIVLIGLSESSLIITDITIYAIHLLLLLLSRFWCYDSLLLRIIIAPRNDEHYSLYTSLTLEDYTSVTPSIYGIVCYGFPNVPVVRATDLLCGKSLELNSCKVFRFLRYIQLV